MRVGLIVAALDMVVCVLDEGIMLLGQLANQYLIVLLAKFLLAFLDKLLADGLSLTNTQHGSIQIGAICD